MGFRIRSQVRLQVISVYIVPLHHSRICPGKHLAENSVFIIIASLLSMFDISPSEKSPLQPEFGLNLVRYV